MTHEADRRAEQWSRLGLAEALRWAVPLRMLELRGLGSDTARRRRLPPSVAANIYRGDAVMFTGKNWKSAALGFDAYAWTLAYLAYTPGGVTILDVHWCAGTHSGCPHDTEPAPNLAGPWREPLVELEELARGQAAP